MADDPYTNPDPYAPQTAANVSGVTVQQPAFTIGAGGEGTAERYLQEYRQHRKDMEQQRQAVEAKQQLSTDEATKLLDETTKQIRARRDRPGLALLTLGANMMGPGNFGDQLGRGLRAMGPQIQAERTAQDQDELTIANLGIKKAELANAPLKTKLDYLRALELGDVNAQRAIEQAQIRSGNQAQQQQLNQQKLQAGILQKASAEAMNQFKELNKDNDYTQEEAQKLYRKLLERQLTLQAGGAGVQLNEEYVRKALDMPMPAVGVQTNLFPKTEDMQKEGARVGLPDMPPTYQDMGPKDRAKERSKQADAYRAEAKGWDEQAAHDKASDEQLREAEAIIRAHPDLLGMISCRAGRDGP